MRNAVNSIANLTRLAAGSTCSSHILSSVRTSCRLYSTSQCSASLVQHRRFYDIREIALQRSVRSHYGLRHYRTSEVLRAKGSPPPNDSKDIPISAPSRGVVDGSSKLLSWRDFDPAGGLPLPEGDLEPQRLKSIFGADIDPETGNWIVRLMNYRRQSGALIDQGIDFSPDTGISKDQAYKALLFLRELQPDFDENKAGVAWAEDQIQELSSEYVERAERLGIYRKAEDEPEAEPAEESSKSEDVYGESQLVNMKRQAEERFQEEERLRKEREEEERQLEAQRLVMSASEVSSRTAEEQASSPDQPTSSTTGLSSPASNKAALHRPERAAWVKHYEDRATLTKDPTAPIISNTRRIVPSLLVTLLVLCASYLLHANYVSPPTSARLYPDSPPALATIALIASTTLALALAYRLPPLWRFFNAHMIQVPAYPSAASVFTATFTHQTFSHWFWNMALLAAFGTLLHEDVGRGTFLAVFAACGTVGNMVALLSHVAARRWATYAFGSSTAVYGVLAAACLLRADADVEVGGVKVPMVGAAVLGVFTAMEVALFMRAPAMARNVQFEAHFGGLAAGVACAVALRWEAARKRREAEAEAEVKAGRVEGEMEQDRDGNRGKVVSGA